jgi:GxxExxY protein
MTKVYSEYDALTSRILKCAYEIHTALGSGLLESAYKECLYYKLTKEGLFVEKEKPMPLVFEEVKLEIGYRIDLLVENAIVLELKTVDTFNDIHIAQLLTYLRLGNFKVGYLMNFKESSLKNGIRRYVN